MNFLLIRPAKSLHQRRINMSSIFVGLCYKNSQSPDKCHTVGLKFLSSSSMQQFCRTFVFLSVLVVVTGNASLDGRMRLSRDLIPRHYTVRLLPHILDESENAIVDGFVQINVRCAQDTRQIVLHAVDVRVNLESIKVYDRASRERFFVQNITHEADSQFVILNIRRKFLVKGANYVISMNFISRLNSQDKPRGFYRLKYMEAGQPSVMALTQLEPVDARKVFPCFDEPNMKADFTIIVGRPSNMISVSNMPLYKSSRAEEFPGYEWDFFHRSFSMSTYLVSIAILDTPSWLSLSDGNVKLRLWARPSLLNQTRYSLKVARKMLDFYQSYLSVEFPLPKQDLIAVPNTETAMENWGLMIFGEQFLTYEAGITSSDKQELNILAMAHEFGHQWFGNLVTLDWWADLWLNEGLATFLSYVAVDQVFPEYQMEEKFVLNELQKVMQEDASPTSHPVSQPVTHPDEINSVFDAISYKKGASLLRMLNKFIGEKTFKQGLTRYLKKLEYGNAVQDDLWAAFTRQAAINKVKLPYDIKSVMQTWTHNVGYPVVTISRNYSARTATAVQSRFLLYQDNDFSNENNDLWVIPLTFITSLNEEPKLKWLPPLSRAENIPDLNADADQYVISNVNRSGFYRVNYDERNWNLIWAQLLHDPKQIPTISRAELVDDAFHLARADLLPYRMALNLANYLRKETEYLPWRSAFDVFQYIDAMLTRMPSTHEAFKQFTIGILAPLYEQLSVFGQTGDEMTLRLLSEATKWACHCDHKDCVENAIVVYREWMARPNDLEVVPADLKRAITCTAVRHLNWSEWQFAWTKFQESNIQTEKIDLLNGMACTTNASLLSTMLEWTLDSSNHENVYFVDVMKSIASESLVGRDLAFNFLRSNWKALKRRYDGRPNFALECVTFSFNNLSDLEKLDSFKSEHGENDFINYLYRIIETNVLWMAKHYQPIDEWLHQLRI